MHPKGEQAFSASMDDACTSLCGQSCGAQSRGQLGRDRFAEMERSRCNLRRRKMHAPLGLV